MGMAGFRRGAADLVSRDIVFSRGRGDGSGVDHASPYFPASLSTNIGADSVDNILGIIASSMLTVTTFSLSTMVSAYSAATSSVTPRATRLVMEDSTTQNVLATFVGSFLFSLVGIIALTTGVYGAQGRVVLFIVTIAVIVLIVVTLLRWIDHLSRLGRVTETTRQVEEATLAAVRAWQEVPNLGGRPLPAEFETLVVGASPIFTDRIGYVQHVDTGACTLSQKRPRSRSSLRPFPENWWRPETRLPGSAVNSMKISSVGWKAA